MNLEKHGVAFEEAAEVLRGQDVVELPDLRHRNRMVTIGFSRGARLLTVVSADVVEQDRIRIISARRATPGEHRLFARRD